jgi:transcriptional regulator with XRE-family HTH domain
MTETTPNADLVRRWRERRGFTQQQAAEWYGVTERSWQRYESGERPVPRPLLIIVWRSEKHARQA